MRLPIEEEYKMPIDDLITKLKEAKKAGHTHFVSRLEIMGYETGFVQATTKESHLDPDKWKSLPDIMA